MKMHENVKIRLGSGAEVRGLRNHFTDELPIVALALLQHYCLTRPDIVFFLLSFICQPFIELIHDQLEHGA